VALPREVRVKISSEAAGSIAMAEVSVRSLPIRDLIEQMLGLTGKDSVRIQEVLRRGSLVAGESRLRWDGFSVASDELAPVLGTFPDSEPHRPFDPGKCFHVQLLAGRERLDMSPNAARKRLFRRRSFWDVLMALGAGAEYVEYSYKLRCDHYRLRLDVEKLGSVQTAAALLRSEKVRERVRKSAFDTVEYFVRR
jgi:hypothetical protein